jgi:predicted Zn-dependent protease with MMP-like domain
VERKRFDRLVKRAIDSLPERFRRYMENVVVAVQDWADEELLEETGEDELLGIYIGTPLTQRHLEDPYRLPDQILIFQKAIEEMCQTEEEIVEQIRLTVIHEIGHFFGLSEEEIEQALGP